MRSDNQETDWQLVASLDFPVKIAWNATKSGIWPTRTILLLIEEPDFNENNLRRAFRLLSEQYSEPHTLFIKAYSSREMLRREIAIQRSNVCIHFVSTEEEEKNVRLWLEGKLPVKTGYLRAHYRRIREQEKFTYTPDSTEAELRKIILI